MRLGLVAAFLGLLMVTAMAMPTEPPPLILSHAWIVVSTGAPERRALEEAGFRIAPTVNHHEGQGTSSVTVEFLNGFLELIYPDPAVRVSPELEAGAEKFRLKSRWPETGYSPFGIVFDRTSATPTPFPFSTWKVSAQWMAPGAFIEMLTPRELPKGLSLSVSSVPAGSRDGEAENARLAQDPNKGAMFLHPNGTRRMTALRVEAPDQHAYPPAVKYLADHNLMHFAVGTAWVLDLTLDHGTRGVARDLRPTLPLVIHY